VRRKTRRQDGKRQQNWRHRLCCLRIPPSHSVSLSPAASSSGTR
jgi:hypothetical protein